MHKTRAILTFIFTVLMLTTVYAQKDPDTHVIKSIVGTVTSTDSVGNLISIRTEDQKDMAFSVPDKAVIRQDTLSTGLMDIEKSDPVTIQYYVSSSSRNIVVSIIDNKSVVNE